MQRCFAEQATALTADVCSADLGRRPEMCLTQLFPDIAVTLPQVFRTALGGILIKMSLCLSWLLVTFGPLYLRPTLPCGTICIE